MKLLILAALAACAGPTNPMNRAGIAVAPGVAGAEYERFLDDDADRGSWSIGVTAGMIWRGPDEMLVTPRKKSATILAFNPFVRWHAWRPTEWLTLGLDAKLSLVWFLPDSDLSKARFALSVESHPNVAADYKWTYLLLGIGVKRFLWRTDVESTQFPNQLTMPAGELSLGARF